MRRSLFTGLMLASCLVLFGAGCAEQLAATVPDMTPAATTTMDTPMAVPGQVIGWSPRGTGIDRAEVSFSTSTASQMVIYRFSLADHAFAFRHSTSAAAVSEWSAHLPEALFVANGVYFHEDQLPSGWLKAEGKTIGSRSFDADKSGLLVLGPKPRIVTVASTQKTAKEAARNAAQSFPLLIGEGKALVKEDSGKVARRTFVGIDTAQAYLYVGVVPYTGISLYELSQALARLPIRWESVLNLDGGPSTGFAFRSVDQPETIDSYLTVPNVLVVFPHS